MMFNMSTVSYHLDAEASSWNISNNLENLEMDSNFVWLLCSLISAISWVVYITYYNSRLAGYIITKCLNKFVIKNGYMKIGSFTLNALAGKIMFRDIIYVTHDYSIRIQDGYLIFRWWRSYVPKDVSEDLSHSDTRLSVVLNGFEMHVYNRSSFYSHLEKVFGLDLDILPESNEFEKTVNLENKARSVVPRLVQLDIIFYHVFTFSTENNVSISKTEKKQRPEAAMARTWRDLIPVIKMDITSVCLNYYHFVRFLKLYIF